MIDFRQLIDAGLHFGHQKSRWCPKMKPFIWGHRGGIHLIDISKTAHALEKTAAFLESIVAKGETVLWVGTKKSAKEMIGLIGHELKMPYVNYRWVGGTITNYNQVKKAVTKLLHYEDIISKSSKDSTMYTKKELGRFQKLSERLERSVGGLKELRMPIGAVVLLDVRKEQTALLEANGANIPVIALVDTNADPSGIDFIIPGNDDSTKGIKFVLDYLSAAAKRGLAQKVEVAKKIRQEEELKATAKKQDKNLHDKNINDEKENIQARQTKPVQKNTNKETSVAQSSNTKKQFVNVDKKQKMQEQETKTIADETKKTDEVL